MLKIFLLLLVIFPSQLFAQQDFSSFKKYPFPTDLCAAPKGSGIAWALDEEGKRNVYVAEGPDYKPRRITGYNKDDGQEITSLSISGDGKWVVFVRGGDHSGNWGAGLPTNPSFQLNPFKIQIACVPFSGGNVKYLSEGDAPVISPDSRSVAFIKGDQIWTCQIDGSVPAKNLFTTHGVVHGLEWNPVGNSILFVTNRTDHSLIGNFNFTDSSIKWIAPSFHNDLSPKWSPDGKQIVYVEMNGTGGEPDSIIPLKFRRWNIYTADVATGTAKLLWRSPNTLFGSFPTTHGGANLHWAADNKIVFLANLDGWPHLYSINTSGGREMLLTPGKFMCEHIVISTDNKWLTFSANTGPDKLDVERRHVVMVSVSEPGIRILTPGDGLEWTPVLINNNTVAFISATALRPPLPSIMQLNGNDSKIKLLGEELVPADFPKEKMVVPQQVIFRSPDGTMIHADLFLPPGNEKKAAIIYVHGGPPRQMLLGWNYSDYYSNAYASNQYLASLGFVVLSVNYRLGIGYGTAFHVAANSGPAGASEYQDVKAAGEWLKKQTFVSAGKIGIYGGSYGGYLTGLALARDSKLFAAGVDIHGVNDWSVQFQSSDKFEKAPDYQKAFKTSWTSSPVASMKMWKSPVLIIHGDDDRNVRFNQSTDLINRLEKYKVPYESILIVDDTHHWMKWSNAVKVYGAVADFFVRKLK